MKLIDKLFGRKHSGVPKSINPPPPPPRRTIADRLHDSYHIQWKVEEEIYDLFEKHQPDIYDSLDFNIGSDDYDNSIEIYFQNPLPYPYEPPHIIRQAIYDMGFSIVYWNFMADKKVFEESDGSKREYHDEIRGYEPRHSRKNTTWIPCKYGYVDERFNEEDWLKTYGPKKPQGSGP